MQKNSPVKISKPMPALPRKYLSLIEVKRLKCHSFLHTGSASLTLV